MERLERSCREPSAAGGARDRIRIGLGADGIERAEAHFVGQAFSPHRHDSYAIGVTLRGVQAFSYRGEQRYCLPGQCHILHPDETHDGGAGTEDGFGYRIIYIDPSLVQEALGGKPLPFVAAPVVEASILSMAFASAVWAMDEPIDDLARCEIACMIADTLVALSSSTGKNVQPLRLASLRRVRDMIAACPAEPHSAKEFERLSGLDRWTMARQFRSAFGTSPGNFRKMRQLDAVRRSVLQGASLAEASADAGFADQSHVSRHFKRALGLTPGRWALAVA